MKCFVGVDVDLHVQLYPEVIQQHINKRLGDTFE